MQSFLRSILGQTQKESRQGLNLNQPFDSAIESLDDPQTLLLVRQMMALSRRRRCATNHLGEHDCRYERSLDGKLLRWYQEFGNVSKNEAVKLIADDLKAIFINSGQTSQIVNKRVLLTDYFSRSGSLEDYYSYGSINPFVFGGTSFRDTLFDRMDFPTRIATIISFDPEVKGHRHQIRYFRALLVANSMANLLSDSGNTNESVRVLQSDKRSFANSWLAAGLKMRKLEIVPEELPPDGSLLYNQGKVYESAGLFGIYEALSENY